MTESSFASFPQHATALAFEPFLGEWKTTGSHGMIPDVVLHGRASIDRIAPGGFLRVRSSIREDVGIPAGVELIGRDGDSGRTVMLHHDERGVNRIYDASLEDGVLKWWRDGADFSQRYTLTLSDDGRTMTGRGEISQDGSTWEQDLDLTYTRVEP
jgi:hypothetical protein